MLINDTCGYIVYFKHFLLKRGTRKTVNVFIVYERGDIFYVLIFKLCCALVFGEIMLEVLEGVAPPINRNCF